MCGWKKIALTPNWHHFWDLLLAARAYSSHRSSSGNLALLSYQQCKSAGHFPSLTGRRGCSKVDSSSHPHIVSVSTFDWPSFADDVKQLSRSQQNPITWYNSHSEKHVASQVEVLFFQRHPPSVQLPLFCEVHWATKKRERREPGGMWSWTHHRGASQSFFSLSHTPGGASLVSLQA